jgi:hypothetical protein
VPLSVLVISCAASPDYMFDYRVVTELPTPLPAPLVTPAPPVYAPTSEPTSPTPAPTQAPCADGNHGCETTSTRCIPLLLAGTVLASCECLPSFVPDPDSLQRCIGSMRPTVSPTHVPSMEPCSDGAHDCDPASTECIPVDDSYSCICLEGYVASSLDSTLCLATTTPTGQ